MLGKHTMKHWSSTQASIALSSGEAEFAGLIRGAGQGLGYQALLRDLGVGAPLRVWTDSTAAIGICTRQGLGKLRHLDTHTLWIQQAVRTNRVDLKKVLGEKNPADLLTKHSISRQRLGELVTLFGCRYLEGRAESAPAVRDGATSKTTMADAQLNDVGEYGESSVSASSSSPTMPHLEHSDSELDKLYPSVQTPSEEELVDVADDRQDVVFQSGLRIAEAISLESQTQGRRRRPEPIASQEDDKAKQETAATARTTPQTASEPDETSVSVLARHRRSAVQSDLDYVGSEEECLVLPPSDAYFQNYLGIPSASRMMRPATSVKTIVIGRSGRAGPGSIPGSYTDQSDIPVQSCLSSHFISST